MSGDGFTVLVLVIYGLKTAPNTHRIIYAHGLAWKMRHLVHSPVISGEVNNQIRSIYEDPKNSIYINIIYF